VLHPVTRLRLEKLGLLESLHKEANIELVNRMDYFAFNALLRSASFVATDGGSNQEECALLGIPCVLLRRTTERVDGLENNAFLCDLDEAQILEIAFKSISKSGHLPAYQMYRQAGSLCRN